MKTVLARQKDKKDTDSCT